MNKPEITFENKLEKRVELFDSFSAEDEDNYYGKLTSLGSVEPGGSTTVTGLHGALNVVIAFDNDGAPVGRYKAMFNQKAFAITPEDVAGVAEGRRLVDLMVAHPQDPFAVKVGEILRGTGDGDPVTKFEELTASTAEYAHCTYASYMLALTDRAKHPASPPRPEARVYSLSMLCNLLGGAWPKDFPDVEVRDFRCTTRDDVLKLDARIRLTDLPFENAAIAKNVLSLLPVPEVDAELTFSYDVGLGLFRTTLRFVVDDFHIPAGGGNTVTMKAPTVSFDISPLFKFAVFKAQATIPFDVFGKEFDANLILVIDNIEAQVSAEIVGDNSSLPAPPPMKGVHFDEFGIGMGIVFEPPSFVLGLMGRFHIGEGGSLVALNDDRFAVICGFEGEVPNPLYVSFYVPALDLPTLVEIFTDVHMPLDFPVHMKQLSFQWAENPMEPLVLPDGSLTEMAFGCSGYLELSDLQLYGSVRIDIQGIEGRFELAPLTLGSILRVAGDGKGVSLKVDENGNPLRNNLVPKTKAERDAIAKAPLRQFVPPGGAELSVSTARSPYLTLGASVSLLELIDSRVDARVDDTGIAFELDFGGLLTGSMKCVLQDWHNFSATFEYRVDADIPLPTVGGASLGRLPLQAACGAGFDVKASASTIALDVYGGFDFEGVRVSFGPFAANANIRRVTDLLAAVETYIRDHAAEVFSWFVADATRWAGYVQNGIIHGVDELAPVLQAAFGKSVQEAAGIIRYVGVGIDEAAREIESTYKVGAATLASALSQGYNATAGGVASALRAVGYGATEAAQALENALGLAPQAINDTLQSVGFAADQVKGAFEQLGGEFESFAKDTWGQVEEKMNPTNW